MNKPATVPVLQRLVQTCDFCPAQWEGRTADDRPVYIKGRHGMLSARNGPPGGTIHDAVQAEELARIPHEEADVLSAADIRCLLENTFDFSHLQTIMTFQEWVTDQ